MGSKRLEIAEGVNECFQGVHDSFCTEENSSVLIAHFGEFSQDLVNSISEGLEYILIESEIKKKYIKRMFSIIIEGLQNIRLHAARNDSNAQHGHVIVAKQNSDLRVSFGNYVENKRIQELSDYLDELNKLDPTAIKERYLKVLGNGFISNKGGAGLGFITIAMKSASKLNYDLVEIDNKISYFHVELRLEMDA